MAFAHNFNAAATHVFFLCVLVVSLKTSMNASAATWSFRDEVSLVLFVQRSREDLWHVYKLVQRNVECTRYSKFTPVTTFIRNWLS